MSWIGGGILIFHLIPFLVLDYEKTLTFLGIIVNSAVLVFVDPTKLLVASSTASAVLLACLHRVHRVRGDLGPLAGSRAPCATASSSASRTRPERACRAQMDGGAAECGSSC